jgi:dihydrodipicolinate synthase/N-acetylneuraminate lyase
MATKLTGETLKGVWAGVTAPWSEDFSFDEASFRTNLGRLIDNRVAGIYTTGSTGEFYAFDWPEFQRLIDIFTEVVLPTGIPTQVGCCGDNTRDILRKVEYAASKGAGGAQIVIPYWMELTDREMLQYFRDVSSAVPDLPLIHYNIPRAKRFLTGPDYRRVLEVAPNLVGVKWTFAGSHFGELQQALALCPGLSFFVAENLLVSAMMLGAKGSYSSVVCTNPQWMGRLFELGEAGQWDEALKMQRRLVEFFEGLHPVIEELGVGSIDPVADKGMAAASGFFVGSARTRPPYIGWTDDQVQRVRAWMEADFPEFMAP